MSKKIVVTLVLIALFRIMAGVTLPGVDSSSRGILDVPQRISVVAIGLRPLTVAFLLVELWSLTFPAGRKLRRSGTLGRQTLNVYGIRAAIFVALMQAFGIAIALQHQPNVVPNPGLSFFLATTVTLVAGTALTCLIGHAISHWGVGNGFCLLAVFPLAWSSVRDVAQSITAGRFFASNFEPLVWIVVIGLVLKIFLHRPTVAVNSNLQGRIAMTLPAFPQSLAPALDSFSVFELIPAYYLLFLNRSITGVDSLPLSIAVPATILLMTILSAAYFHLFSSRKRLDSNLPAGAMLPEFTVPTGRWSLPTTVFLVIFGTGFHFGYVFGFISTGIVGFPEFVLLLAVTLDMIAEVRFHIQHDGKVEPLIEMDNVYGACYLRASLENHGIVSMTRAFQYRSLLYFFGPLTKMKLFVPAAELARAQEIIRAVNLEIV